MKKKNQINSAAINNGRLHQCNNGFRGSVGFRENLNRKLAGFTSSWGVRFQFSHGPTLMEMGNTGKDEKIDMVVSINGGAPEMDGLSWIIPIKMDDT